MPIPPEEREDLALDIPNTARRFAKAYEEEFLASYRPGAYESFIKGFTLFKADGRDSLVVEGPIEFVSTCSHHLLPFAGEAYVGYLPGDFLVGASKLARTIDFFSKKLQLQERLGRQAADFLHKQAKARFTAVLLHATHSCMSCRGVRQNAKFVTAAIRPHDETFRGLIDEFYHHVSLIQHARDF